MGDSDFVRRSIEKADGQPERKYRIRAKGYDFDKISRRVSDVSGIPIQEVLAPGKNRGTVQARSLLCYRAARECGMSMVESANKFGISSTAIGISVARGENMVSEMNLKLFLRMNI